MPFTVSDIFKNEDIKHRLTQFKQEEITWLEARIFEKSGKPYLKCWGSDRDRPAKPEEIVRQLWIKKLIEEYHYAKERIQVERAVWFGSGVSEKSADIIILHTDLEHPYIIFEVKKPKRKDGIQQLKSYCNAEGSPIGAWSNGEELVVLHREDPNVFTSISNLPTAGQRLQDVITEQWTIDKLSSENKLVREKLSLKKIILDLEDLVLANAEGIDDSFDEIFKLIYAKLFDEWAATNDPRRRRKIDFRIYGESPRELKDKINNLLRSASDKWRGVFPLGETIKLKEDHLLTCISFLQDVKLFNANLQVIDDAFEYLSVEVAKGKKGQYFTPRWVIDMCVKMLNPKIHERVIDPACGSAGFTVHSIFWVAGQKFTAEGSLPQFTEYAANMVYGIDSSPKAVKIAKALNLIAGDGKSNVYELNSLNPPKWNDTGKAAFKDLLTRFADNPDQDTTNQNNFEYFDFDVLLTNPPFAGNINERDILKQYRLAEKRGSTVSKIGRDILFIERCLKFLRDGGRMAIVLPQGRLNNTNDLFIRNFIFDKARVLAVVGLHGNTFKPHTGTKTSVMFLQKYTDNELLEIHTVLNRHAVKWQTYLSELQAIATNKNFSEDNLSRLLVTFLQAEFEVGESVESSEDENSETEAIETDDELTERINDLSSQLAGMPKRAKGKAQLQRTLLEAKRKLAARSLIGQLNWILQDEKLLGRYRDLWLSEMAADELDYPVFLAVSSKGGKDNSGEPVYKKDANDERILDHHEHLIVDHDLDEIADAFVNFATEQGFDFWVES